MIQELIFYLCELCNGNSYNSLPHNLTFWFPSSSTELPTRNAKAEGG
jgi:hypothetical protein